MAAKRKTWPGRVYLGTDDQGKEMYSWVGRFATRKERDAAVARRRVELEDELTHASRRRDDPGSVITCEELVAEYLTEYAEKVKASSLVTARQALKAFTAEFGDRPIGSIDRDEAKVWAKTVPTNAVMRACTLFNWATVEDKVTTNNPFRRLATRSDGRAKQPPPRLDELRRLLDACDILNGPIAPDYGDRMRDLVAFAAYTLTRPSEFFELRRRDVEGTRIHVHRRLYKGVIDTPKSGVKTIALPPPAREILLRQPEREGGLIFASKTGKRLQETTLSQYWKLVRAAAGLDFELYHATKHYGVHLLYKLGMSPRGIASQAGWSEATVDSMLRIYGHADLVALEEIDKLYETGQVIPIGTARKTA
jgi:integrase